MAFRGRSVHSDRRRLRGALGDGRRGGSSVPPPLGDVLATIQHRDLDDCTTESHCPFQITNTKYLTSYNWVRGNHEVIVPGEPPAWTPLSEPTQLRPDSSVYFRDLNMARYPTYPLEPMVRAILKDIPRFCGDDLDIVGCGSTMGNLLRFARRESPAFRMLIEVVGNSVFFSRRENSPKETLRNVQGYGHTFPETYTMWSEGVRNSESHQRLIKFEFANMNFLVRFEADGYLPDLIPGNLKTQEEPVHIKSHMEPEDLLSSIKAASISIDPSETSEQEAIDLKISKGGRYIPQCAIFDLKTRSVKKEHIDTLSEEMGRLWIRQIPNFILAYHKSGKFDDIRVQDVRENMKQWEESEQPDLQRFATLLQTIISFARSTENERLELEHGADEEVLNIRVPGGIVNSVLPPALADRWNARSGSVTNS